MKDDHLKKIKSVQITTK